METSRDTLEGYLPNPTLHQPNTPSISPDLGRWRVRLENKPRSNLHLHRNGLVTDAVTNLPPPKNPTGSLLRVRPADAVQGRRTIDKEGVRRAVSFKRQGD